MDISQQDFERIRNVVGEYHRSPEQSQVLGSIGFDVSSDCNTYIGKYFPDEEWERPDPEQVYLFFQTTLTDFESRHREFENNPTLSQNELEMFTEFRKNEYVENEGFPSIFTGSIEVNDSELVVFVSRYGSMDEELLGVFSSYSEGVSILFPRGEIL